MDYKQNIIDSLRSFKNDTTDSFKIRAYNKVINNINAVNVPIISYSQIEKIEGIGKSIRQKIKDVFDRPPVVTPAIGIKSQLLQVYGVGPKKAAELVDVHKVKSIEDLAAKSKKDPKLLTDGQKIGLICYYDLLERIPRREMKIHKKILDLSKEKGEIVGSFRRKEESSGDIDVMLNMDVGEFNKFVDELIRIGYIKYTLARGDKKLLGVCQLPGGGKYRRIDLIRNTPEEYPYMKLYFTGSAKFNVAFRKHCLTLGLSLNEHSFTPEVKELKTERDIFRHVGLEYVKPKDRR